MEAENRRIMEFASQRQQMEEIKMEKIREREEAKENLYKTVETLSSEKNKARFSSINGKVAFQTTFGLQMTHCNTLFSCRGSFKRKYSGVRRWSACVRIFMLRKRSRPRGRERL